MTLFTAPLDARRQRLVRAADQVERLGRLPEQAERIAGVEVGQTPSRVVYEENKLSLLQYESRTDEQYDVPILIVYALINRPYVLDLQPSRSVVRTLLDQGFDVYLVDWGEPSRLDATLGLQDYVERYIENCVDVVRERSGQEAINLLGYCMGGTMSAMYAALRPEKVRNLGLLAAGLCFDDTGGVLERWGDEAYFDPELLVDTYGNVPAEFLDVGFALMDPVENYVTKYVYLYDNLDDDDFVENFARMERWLGEGIDVAGAAYEEFLEGIYQDNALARNEFRLDGERIDLGRIDMPVIQIVGEFDHLIPPESSVPFNDLIASEDTEVIEFPTGHIGLSVSSRSHAELWPQVGAWFAERSGGGGPPTGEDTPSEAGESPVDTDTPTDADADTAEATSPAAADVEEISGIGPVYAERLRSAGVATVGDLAEADAEAVAAETDLSTERLDGWIEQARAALGRGAG